MKKFLFLLFLICSVETTHAVTIDITKVYGRITTSFSGTTKDSLLKNNASISSNLAPINTLTFYFRWKDLDVVSAPFGDMVYFKVYQVSGTDETEIASMAHTIQSSDSNDSTLIYAPLNLSPANPEGTYSFKMKITYYEDPQTETIIEESNDWTFSIVPDPNKILYNTICCSDTVTFPFTPGLIQQKAGTAVTAPTAVLPITFIWQQKTGTGGWTTITGATGASYQPPTLTRETSFQRIAFVKKGTSSERYSISNTVSYTRAVCARPPYGPNTICGDQAFYNLKHGDTIDPVKIMGSYLYPPEVSRRPQGLQFTWSNDGLTWHDVDDNGIKQLGGLTDPYESDYDMPPFVFDINKGAVQRIYIVRSYYEKYDSWDCGPGSALFPCGVSWHLKSTSNTVTIVLTSFSTPKPAPTAITNESLDDFVDCNPSAQVKTFSVPQINNGEFYYWEIPSAWTSYTALQGAYANSITINTNAVGANYGIGGDVCLTIVQPGQKDRICRSIPGSDPFRVYLPASMSGCEGQTVTVNPVVLINNVSQNVYDYTFTWEAYQTPNYTCTNVPNKYNPDCKGLKITISDAYQNTTQPINVTAMNAHHCITTASTVLTTTPGLQMGILNSYSDPKALAASTLAPDTTNNYLYFTDTNGNIERAYFDNTQQLWKYVVLKSTNINKPISSDGPIVFYKSTTTKLFYIFRSNLYYAESTDGGINWIDNPINGALVSNIDSRIRISGNNIYYISNQDHKVYYKSIDNTTAPAVLIGNVPVNYSQNMFTVEEGILAYADQNNNIVAYDAITGTTLSITVTSFGANLKTIAYNSSIAVYNQNIYFVSTANTLRVLQKSAGNAAYTLFQEAATQLAGPFAINRQTGTVYAKAYDVAGRQIYFLNNQWNSKPIKNYLDADPIQSAMVYANNHAYYIGTNGLVSNTFYIAPCVPDVLRTAHTPDNLSGETQHDPLPANADSAYTLLVYPNPVHDQVNVRFTLTEENNIRIRIMNIAGGNEEIMVSKYAQEGNQEVLISLSQYAAGAYFIQLYVGDNLTASSKVLKY